MKAATFVTSLVVTLASALPIRAGGFERAIERVLPRIVKLYGVGAGLQKGFGSGVLVSADGLVVTVYSLLVDADTVRAVTADGTVYEARLVAHDRARQLTLLRLAVLKADNRGGGSQPTLRGASKPVATNAHETHPDPFPFFDVTCPEASESSDAWCGPMLRPGDWVIAAGNAFKVADGSEPVSITHGVFSARTRLDARRRKRDFPYRGDVLVIDAITSNPGEPGSALVNLDGEFVGLIGRQVVSNLTHTHFNYAIPRDVVAAFVVDARATERAGRYAVVHTDEQVGERIDPGIRITRAGFQTVLPFVERVVRGSPAYEAGVRKDDLVLSVNGHNVATADEYRQEIRRADRDDSLNLVLRRNRKILTVQIGGPKHAHE